MKLSKTQLKALEAVDTAEKEGTIRGMTMVCHEMNPNIRKKLISIGLLKMTEFGPLMLWLELTTAGRKALEEARNAYYN